ncbi:hypothetical protein FO519_003956 [Halicephalobus sp. NKZ332]|nr:hypothetical protein FO519_003956 [Halicephalobus sp. NKZ332]
MYRRTAWQEIISQVAVADEYPDLQMVSDRLLAISKSENINGISNLRTLLEIPNSKTLGYQIWEHYWDIKFENITEIPNLRKSLGCEAVKCYSCQDPCPHPRPLCEDNYCYFVGSVFGSQNETEEYGCSSTNYLNWVPANISLGQCEKVPLGVATVYVRICEKDFCNEPCAASSVFLSISGIVFVFGLHSVFH